MTFKNNSAISNYCHYICAVFIGLFSYIFPLFAQKNNDCHKFVYVCRDTIFPISSNGPGEIIEIPKPSASSSSVSNPVNPADSAFPSQNIGCLLTGETFSTWILFPVKKSGILEFYFATDNSPYPQKGFYDWILYNFTGRTCQEIIDNKLPPVRCNWNSKKVGGTGLADSLKLPPGGDPTNYEPPLEVKEGEIYIMCFNNFEAISTNVPMQFGGTSELGINKIPQISITGDFFICRGDTAILTVENELNGVYYLWSNGANTKEIKFSPANTTSISVTTSLISCTNNISYDSVIVRVDTSLNSLFAISDPDVTPLPNQSSPIGFCQNEEVKITYLGDASLNATFNWDFNEATVLSGEKKGPFIVKWETENTKTVKLHVTEERCIADPFSKIIFISQRPVADFEPNPPIAVLSEANITFNNLSEGVNADIIWDFGDNITSYLNRPIHSYSDFDTFLVKLTVFNGYGCSNSIIKEVIILPDLEMFIPNTFTPNDDGKNDHYIAQGRGIKDFKMYIFNMWGLEIFSSNSVQSGWDGKFIGSFAPAGSYIYLFVISDNGGKEHRFLGDLLLLK